MASQISREKLKVVARGGFMVIKTEEMEDGTPADRRSWAWADPDNAFNVDKLVNNSSFPVGGPEDCPWSEVNCGPMRKRTAFILKVRMLFLLTEAFTSSTNRSTRRLLPA